MSQLDDILKRLGRIYPEAQEVVRIYEGYPQFWGRELRARGMEGAASYVEEIQLQAGAAAPVTPTVPEGYPVRDGAAPLRTIAEWEALPDREQLDRMAEVDFLLAHGEWGDQQPTTPAHAQEAPPAPAVPEIPAADLVPAQLVAAANQHAATTVQPPPGKAPLETIEQWEALPEREQLDRMAEVDALLAAGQ